MKIVQARPRFCVVAQSPLHSLFFLLVSPSTARPDDHCLPFLLPETVRSGHLCAYCFDRALLPLILTTSLNIYDPPRALPRSPRFPARSVSIFIALDCAGSGCLENSVRNAHRRVACRFRGTTDRMVFARTGDSWEIGRRIAATRVSGENASTRRSTTGQSASYNFSVLPVGASFAGAVSFSCAGGPEPLCSFTPSSVTPGNSSAAVVMTITTTSSSASLSSHGPGRTFIFYALWLALPGFVLLGIGKQNRKHVSPAASLLGLFLLALLLSSCGGGGSNGGRSGASCKEHSPALMRSP